MCTGIVLSDIYSVVRFGDVGIANLYKDDADQTLFFFECL
jgi:hypothetical protein